MLAPRHVVIITKELDNVAGGKSGYIYVSSLCLKENQDCPPEPFLTGWRDTTGGFLKVEEVLIELEVVPKSDVFTPSKLSGLMFNVSGGRCLG